MNTPPSTFAGLVDKILEIIGFIIPLIFAVVFLFLVWKIFDSWVINADDETKRTEGRQYALVAVIVFVVMSMVWGIVQLFRSAIFGA